METYYRNRCVVEGCTSSLPRDKHLGFFFIPPNRQEEWLPKINKNRRMILNKKSKICSLHFDDTMILVHRTLKIGATPIYHLPESTDVTTNTGHLFTTDKLTQTDNMQFKLWEINYLRSINNQKIYETETKTVETQSILSQKDVIEKTSLRLQKQEKAPLKRDIQSDEISVQIMPTPDPMLVETQSIHSRKGVIGKTSSGQKMRVKSSLKRKIQRKEVSVQTMPTPNSMLTNTAKDEFGNQLFKLHEWANTIKEQFEGRHNTKKFKAFAVNFYISCTPLYDNLKNTHKLPNPSRLKKIKLDISFRFDPSLLIYLREKLKLLPNKAKYCSLFIDSIDIKPELHYNITQDQIIGLHLPIQGFAEKATTAYVIMMRGIETDWRQIVTYLLLANRNCFPEIESCVNYVLRHLFSIGFQIKALVTNQSTIPYKYAREVLLVVPEKPFFVINKCEIFLIYEPCDLILQLRNILLIYDLVTDDNTKISWKYVKDLYLHKEQYKLSILPNLTEAHISPNDKQKTDFKYASQVFNTQVTAIMELYISMGILPKDALPTARFIKTISLLIDVFTSSSLKHENQYKSAFTMNKQQFSLLLHVQGIFKTLKVCNEGFNATNKTFECLLITIHSLLLLANKLEEVEISHILTKRLNRHPLEVIKTTINEGHNSDWVPTAVDLKNILGNIFIKQLIGDKRFYMKSNDIGVLLKRGDEITTNLTEPEADVTSTKLTPADLDYRFELPVGRKLTYLSAYLLFKSSKIHRCPDFERIWSNCPPVERVPGISKLLKVPLKKPPTDFLIMISKFDEIFCSRFFVEISRPANKLLNVLKANSRSIICQCFPLEYIMTLFVRHRIYSVLLNNKIISKTNPSSTKIVVERLHCT